MTMRTEELKLAANSAAAPGLSSLHPTASPSRVPGGIWHTKGAPSLPVGTRRLRGSSSVSSQHRQISNRGNPTAPHSLLLPILSEIGDTPT